MISILSLLLLLFYCTKSIGASKPLWLIYLLVEAFVKSSFIKKFYPEFRTQIDVPKAVIGYPKLFWSCLLIQAGVESMAPKKVVCEFNQHCWLTVRLPLIRKHKIYLPYECSYVAMGDMEKCSLRDRFAAEKLRGSEVVNDSLSTEGAIGKNI